MKQDERKALIGKYILLILGSVLILVPLLATLFSSFKPTKDIVDNFFGFPTNFTWDNSSRLLADGIGGYYWNSVVITVLSLLAVMIFIPMAAYSIARNMSKKKSLYYHVHPLDPWDLRTFPSHHDSNYGYDE